MGLFNFPFRLYGGAAARPDSISGFTEPFRQSLRGLYESAPPNVQRELGITSGYRSRATQQQLWDKSDKTGRTVARPGHSKHEFGSAADLWGFGLGGKRYVSPETYDYVHQNAQKFGLYFPMSYEPWHIQAMRGQGSSPGPSDTGLNITADNAASFRDPGTRHVGGAGSEPQYFAPTPQPGEDPGQLDLGAPLQGDNRKKSVAELMADMRKPPIQPPAMSPLQGPGGPTLAEVIQQYLATQMGGTPPGGQGGQGFG